MRKRNFFFRFEPVSVAIDLDNLWLGVIGLSNLTTAGFRRNICKYSTIGRIIYVELQSWIMQYSIYI